MDGSRVKHRDEIWHCTYPQNATSGTGISATASPQLVICWNAPQVDLVIIDNSTMYIQHLEEDRP